MSQPGARGPPAGMRESGSLFWAPQRRLQGCRGMWERAGPGALCSGAHSWTKLKLEEAATFPAIQPQLPPVCSGTPGLRSVLGFCQNGR